MRRTFTFVVLHYPDALCVARSLEPPRLSCAAATAEAAVSGLTEALAERLGRAHPRALARLAPDTSAALPPLLARLEVPLLRQWAAEAEGLDDFTERAPTHVDLTRAEVAPGIEVIEAPLLDLRVFGEATTRPWRELLECAHGRDLRRTLQQRDATLAGHTMSPERATLQRVGVTFTPLDLTAAPEDVRDLDEIPRARMAEAAEHGVHYTPTLDALCTPLSGLPPEEAAARGITPSIGRDDTLATLTALIAGPQPVAVALVGPPRVGKSALVMHLASLCERAGGPPHKLLATTAARLCAPPAEALDWRAQATRALSELERADHILYMGRATAALDAGRQPGHDDRLARMLKPLLTDRRLRLIVEATPQEWARLAREDVGFHSAFEVVRVDALPPAQAEQVIRQAAARLAAAELSPTGHVALPEAVVSRALEIQRRFPTRGSVVGRTLDMLATALRRATSHYAAQVTERDLIAQFCAASGLPELMLRDDLPLDAQAVRDHLARRVMGQPEAVRRVVDVIAIAKAHLGDPRRPLGSFLFTGPTGVGKTELARQLATFLFGSPRRLVRLDMSEYGDEGAWSRLIGASAGRGDASARGELSEPVRQQPFSVVLLDEIEKAHPRVFDLLLQVLGEARLTDGSGEEVGFQNTIVIMTSNLGASTLRARAGFSGGARGAGDAGVASAHEGLREHFWREAERFFRPELLGRLDQLVAFAPLGPEVVAQIARRELDELSLRDGLSRPDVSLSWDEAVVSWLAAEGWDARYGARPLKRVVSRHVVAPLASALAEAAHEPPLRPGQVRRLHLSIERPARQPARVVVTAEAYVPPAERMDVRQRLLAQIQHVSALRRTMQEATQRPAFQTLQRRVAQFTIESQQQQFWSRGRATRELLATQRDQRVVAPVEALIHELYELEELASEAYHGQLYDLVEDVEARAAELAPQLSAARLSILGTAFADPARATIMIAANTRESIAFRGRLIRWYARRARLRDWTLTLWRSLHHKEQQQANAQRLLEDPAAHYRQARLTPKGGVPSEDVLLLEVEGFAARPLMLMEDGLHRLRGPGAALIDVQLLPEHTPWPFPADAMIPRANPQHARVWNLRAGDVSVVGADTVPLDRDDPWPALEPLLEAAAWSRIDGGES